MELRDARVMVAGATGALGAAIAGELHARGARLALLGRDAARLQAMASVCSDAPVARFDAQDAEATAAAVDEVAGALGGLDGAIVSVGAPAFGDVPDAVAAELLTVNTLAPIVLLRAAEAHFGESGTLAAVTGIVAEQPTAGLAAYSAAKAGLSAYLTALRRERRRRGVLVLDARLPHLETPFAGRALHGAPPPLPTGLDVAVAARAVVDALAGGRRELTWDAREQRLITR